MSVTVDLCGRLADPLGPSIAYVLTEPLPVALVLARLAGDHPALGAAMAATRLHIAIDEQLAGDDAILCPGQRLTLFPPVSGG